MVVAGEKDVIVAVMGKSRVRGGEKCREPDLWILTVVVILIVICHWTDPTTLCIDTCITIL